MNHPLRPSGHLPHSEITNEGGKAAHIMDTNFFITGNFFLPQLRSSIGGRVPEA